MKATQRIVSFSNEAKTAKELVEGADYYWEGESMVFTSSFHLRRGYCCQSGCRHCPYEPAPLNSLEKRQHNKR